MFSASSKEHLSRYYLDNKQFNTRSLTSNLVLTVLSPPVDSCFVITCILSEIIRCSLEVQVIVNCDKNALDELNNLVDLFIEIILY